MTPSIPVRLALLAGAAALGLAGCTGGAADPAGGSAASPGALSSPRSPSDSSSTTLVASESMVPFEGGTRWAMTYNGQATGPTIRVRPGEHFSITVTNHLDVPTSLHTHGLHVSPDQDDPFLSIEPGQSHTYEYDVPQDQQAGTYWYHPHTHGVTAEQVASGLSGAIIVEDETDSELAAVTTDRVVVLNDPPLVTANPWASGNGSQSGGHMTGDQSGGHMMGDQSGGHMMGDQSGGHMMGGGSGGVDMMTSMMGRTGPVILANGEPGVALTGSAGKLERVHVVNATASTRMVLRFDGARMLQLAEPGGRLPAPVEAASIELAPGERTEVVLVPGENGGTLTAQRLSNEGAGGPIGQPAPVATVEAAAGTDTSVLPASMRADTRDLFGPDVTVARQRVISLDGHMNPTIDGKQFDPARVDLTAAKGTVEEWVIRNNTPMVHPIHLHAWPFQVEGEPGWQDIVTVPANSERVIRVAFDDFGGTTVIHCHVLDHEDLGMMAVIKVS